MVQNESDSWDVQESARAVDLLLTRYNWNLLTRPDFVLQTVHHFRAGSFLNVQAAAFNYYTLTLYRVCAGTEGPERQVQGYEELGQYLYEVAYRRAPAVARDLTDETISDIFFRFADCRQPGAFVAFALQKLRDNLKRHWRTQAVRIDLDRVAFLPALEDLFESVSQDDHRRRVIACASTFLQQHKKARLQLMAVLMKYLIGLDDATIAERLKKQPKQVYVLRSRGLKQLREEPCWRALAEELGIPLDIDDNR